MRPGVCEKHQRRPARLGLLAWPALLACAAGCQKEGSQPPAAPQPKTNVVLFLIDTLRADRMSLYGHDKLTTPFLDEIAQEAVVFDHAQAPAPWTLPSVPSIMTSTFPCEHGVTVDGEKLSKDIPTLAERFKRLDYFTTSFYVNNFAGPLTGLDRGFDICKKFRSHVSGEDVGPWLDQNAARWPWFLYIHNIEPHNMHNAPDALVDLVGSVEPNAQRRYGRLISKFRPLLRADFDPDPEQRRALGATDHSAQIAALIEQLDQMLDEQWTLYDAVVRHADMRLGSVVAELKQRGLWDDTLFICLSDHGEELSEHGGYLHAQSVYEELTHVPLIIKFPRGELGGRRIADVTPLIDVLPTVFDYLGRPDLIGPARGKSLMPVLRGAGASGEPLRVTSVRINRKKYYRPWSEQRGERNVALRTNDGRYKAIYNVDLGTTEVYDLSADPAERYNLAARDEHAKFTETVRGYAAGWFASCSDDAKRAEVVEISADDLRDLKALGYLGGAEEAGGADESEEPDAPATQPTSTAATTRPAPP